MAIRKHVTLVAATNQAVTLAGAGIVQVTNHGSTSSVDAVYFTVNGTAAVAAADDTYACAPLNKRWLQVPDHDGSFDVNLISAGTPKVSVEIVAEMEHPG